MRKESSTNFENEQILKNYCNAFKTLSLINGRWKLSILFALSQKECLYSELKRTLPSISDRILALQLNQLHNDGLIFKSEETNSYQLSEKGLQFRKVLYVLSEWEACV